MNIGTMLECELECMNLRSQGIYGTSKIAMSEYSTHYLRAFFLLEWLHRGKSQSAVAPDKELSGVSISDSPRLARAHVD